MIRSRARWYEMGEKTTNYFLNLENRNYVNKNIQEIKNDNGDLLSAQNEILNEVKSYYKNLYSKKDLDNQSELLENNMINLNHIKLNENQKAMI